MPNEDLWARLDAAYAKWITQVCEAFTRLARTETAPDPAAAILATAYVPNPGARTRPW